jgi:5-deoxy-glucuronate isomerase
VLAAAGREAMSGQRASADAAGLMLRAGAWTNVTPASAGWDYVSFATARLAAGERLDRAATESEVAIVPLAGRVTVAAGDRTWSLGSRTSVFDGRGDCLYLPRETAWTLSADTDCEIAVCGARCERRLEPRLVRASDLELEVRGAGNATRQIHALIGPEFPADRLLVIEVWTPGGNWSSYPPHKHDQERAGEAVLEETYYFRTRDPAGFALQRLYAPERDVDEAWAARDGDLLLIPWGFHTTCAAHGHDLYYLNVLAGPGPVRTLQAFEDPALARTRERWSSLAADERVPLVPGTGSLA